MGLCYYSKRGRKEKWMEPETLAVLDFLHGIDPHDSPDIP